MNELLQTHYNRIHSDPEVNSGEVIVEKSGYISKKDRIENMILAGQRLEQIRHEMYQDTTGDEEIPVIPRMENLDPTDLDGLLETGIRTTEKLKKLSEEKRKKILEEKPKVVKLNPEGEEEEEENGEEKNKK